MQIDCTDWCAAVRQHAINAHTNHRLAGQPVVVVHPNQNQVKAHAANVLTLSNFITLHRSYIVPPLYVAGRHKQADPALAGTCWPEGFELGQACPSWLLGQDTALKK
jgi:hypothetical protein